jgi:hypothetical protein
VRFGVRWLIAAPVACLVAAGLTIAVQGKPAAAAASTPGSFTSVTPTRLLDTRNGVGAPRAAVAANATVVLQVAGRGGVPPSGVSAVVLNVTVTQPTALGTITVWGGGARPWASNLNFVRGQTVPNLVTTPVAADGTVRLYNGSSGTVQLLADVSGYYLGGTPQRPGMFSPVAPSRLLDTRNGIGAPKAAVAANGTIVLKVDGQGGVPSTGISAVVLNVTVTQPAATGALTVWGGGTRPWVSNLNFASGQTVPNLVLAPVDSAGQVRLYNGSSGTAHMIADVFGFYLAGGPLLDGGSTAVPPSRLLDTRNAVGAPPGPVSAGATFNLAVGGRGWVLPAGASAVVLNVTVTQPSAAGNITVWANGTARPWASNLNFARGQTVANLVVAPVGTNGLVSLYNGSPGSVQVIADVAGYVLGADRSRAPTASTGRYVRNISNGGPADVTTMGGEGCADAHANSGAGPYVVVLHIGAQSQHSPLSANNPGVALSGFSENTTPRLTYPQLVTALDGYLDGYVECRTGGASVTVAIATNNDGDFVQYTATRKGTDWAAQVIEPLRAHATSSNWLDVVGANDIEAGFASSEAQAEQWEGAYLGKTSAKLIFTGSADACPTGLAPSAWFNCGAVLDDNGVAKVWTQANYIQLAHGLNASRVFALPQIYYPTQAWQWAAIALHGNGVHDNFFIGVLTELAAVPNENQLTSEQAWGALWDAISASTQVTQSAPASATDLRADWPVTSSAIRNLNAKLPKG